MCFLFQEKRFAFAVRSAEGVVSYNQDLCEMLSPFVERSLKQGCLLGSILIQNNFEMVYRQE